MGWSHKFTVKMANGPCNGQQHESVGQGSPKMSSFPQVPHTFTSHLQGSSQELISLQSCFICWHDQAFRNERREGGEGKATGNPSVKVHCFHVPSPAVDRSWSLSGAQVEKQTHTYRFCVQVKDNATACINVLELASVGLHSWTESHLLNHCFITLH